VATAIGSAANNIAGQVVASSSYNLIGTGVTPAFGTGNLINDNPGLVPLANNGGKTKTHMPNANSPVIDKGEVPYSGSEIYDQRGNPYARVIDGDGIVGVPGEPAARVDIGAVEYSVGTPRVTDVILEGSDSAWIRDPFRFSTIVESGEQLRPIFAEGIDTIKIQFSEEVVISSNGSELTLVQTVNNPAGGATNTTLDDSDFSFEYFPEILTGVWTLNDPLVNAKYAIHLSATITGGGVALDGFWDNDDNGDVDGNGFANDDNTPDDYADDIGKIFLSGLGMAGTSFRFHFAVLQGDYDQSGVVDAADAVAGVVKDGNGDGNGDGNIDDGPTGADTVIAIANSGEILPLRGVGGADFNDDEKVDGVDLLIWEQALGIFGSSGVAGDADGDGDVDGADFLFWQRAFLSRSAWYTGTVNVGVGASAPLILEGLAPQITNLVISGSISLHDPYSFDTVDGSGSQLQTVPVGGADTISITFSELVSISADSLRLIGLTTANVPQLAEFNYDVMTMTATWRFESWAQGDQYLISLPDSVTDLEGNLLDGEWVNPASVTTVNSLISTFPSGDGTAGGNFNFVATLLPGDANLDGVVDLLDLSILTSNYISPNISPSYYYDGYYNPFDQVFEDGDFNGDGTVNGNDSALMWPTFWMDLRNVRVLADINGDFIVDGNDLNTINDNFGMTGATYADGDLNGDGVVDITDVDLAFGQFGLGLDLVS